MVCSQCARQIPDESAFCLACGTRVNPVRVASANGGGSGWPVAAPVPAGARPPGEPGKKVAYTLAFHAIVDERLRYRVARWVVERAPAYGLGEVQESLLRGDFMTFLALTPPEVEAARHGIQGLGLAPALVRFQPASAGDWALAERRPPKPSRRRGSIGRKEWVTAVGVLLALFAFGLLMMRLFGGPVF